MKNQPRMKFIREMLDEADHLITVADKASFRTLVRRFQAIVHDLDALTAEARDEAKKAPDTKKPATGKPSSK